MQVKPSLLFASARSVLIEKKYYNSLSRRQLLKSGMAICAGSLSCSNFASEQPVVSTAYDPSQLQLILTNFEKAAREQNRLKAAVVSLENQTIFAKAFRGPAIDQAVNIKSVSKSVVATLVGIARQRAVISSLDQTLGELIPELLPKEVNAKTADLTLNHLITMRAGLERTSGRAYGVWVNSDNWIHHALTRPFVDEPGGRMLYSTGDTHILGVVLSQLTGHSLHKLANDWLGKPLGIDFAPWTRDPQGYYMGGNEMSLSPLHLIKLGELYLTNGEINGKKILDTNWVHDAFTPRTESVYSGDGYGYGWFLRDLAGVPAGYARGYGGQVLHVLPELSLTVAITSDATQRARSHGYMTVLHDLVAEKLVAPLIQIR